LPSSFSTFSRTASKRVRRHTGLQRFELFGHPDADQNGAHRQKLAQLDEGRAELCERSADSLLVGLIQDVLADASGEEVLSKLQTQSIEAFGQSVTDQHRQDLAVPLQVLVGAMNANDDHVSGI
jgi:hypothetical protein